MPAVGQEEEFVVIPGSSTPKTRTVVITVDDSDAAFYAVDWARTNFLKAGDLVVLLHCHRQLSLEKDFHTSTAALVKKAAASLTEFNVTATVLTSECVGDRLANKIAELAPDAVICGTRGESGVKRALHGSISDYLMHECSCAVIVPKKQMK